VLYKARLERKSNTMNRIRLFFVSCIAANSLFFSGCETTSPTTARATLPTVIAPAAEPLPVLPAIPEPAPTADLESVLAPDPSGSDALFISSQVEVSKRLIQTGQVNDALRYILEIQVKEDIQGIRVSETLPESIRFVSALPAPKTSGASLFWEFGALKAGASREIVVSVQPLTEGDHKICSEIAVQNQLCMEFFAGQPKLEVAKTGPSTIELNETGTWSVTVANKGSAVARNVTVGDTFPAGLQATGLIEHKLGDLEPEATRTVEFSARAVQQGSFTNNATARYENDPQPSSGSTPVTVVQSAIQITKEGPSKAYVFKPESYQISIKNTGDTDLKNVRITDLLPAGTSVANNGGGRVKDSAIGWVIPTLPAGASQLITTKVAATRPGISTNQAKLLTEQGLEASDTQITEWLAVPGVTISITDTKDPIRVGEATSYTIRVRNQGDFEPVSGTITLQFRDTIKPIAIKGDASGLINGQTVTFPRTTLKPGKDINLEVTAEGAQIGPGRAVLNFSADFLNEPVISQEATNVY
jgi:uncharacterized repeat protein (TIGR01451 family)